MNARSLSRLMVAAAFVSSSFVGACAGQGNGEAERPVDQSFPIVESSPVTQVDTPDASAGYLRSASSTVDPWCGAVLIAPDRVLTATGCLKGISFTSLSFGLGLVGSGPLYKLKARHDAPEHSDNPSRRSDLTVLVLKEPVIHVTPAVLAQEPVVDAARTISYDYTDREDPAGRRRSLTGTMGSNVKGALSAFFSDTPNCHGESGAGLFAMQNGQDVLLGVGWGGTADRRDPAQSGCMRTLAFVPVAENLDFLQAEIAAND